MSRSRTSSDLVLGTRKNPAIAMTMPIGRLMKKMERHSPPMGLLVTSQPPRTGPITAAMAVMVPRMAKIGARSLGRYNACTLASTWGTINPAKNPCSTREATRMLPVWAVEARTDARVNPMIPMRKIRWRP